MAHFALIWKARAVEKYRASYEAEKIKSITLAQVEIPRKRLSEKWRSYRLATSETVSRTFSRWFPSGSAIYKCLLYLRADESIATFLLKTALGFAGGIILTYLCFIFLVFQLSISFMLATIISSIIGVLLTLGLAFSYRIRCLVFLLIPQLFSRVGRYTLTCYALVLILTGPATNTLKNSEVLSESMACSQEHIKTSVRQINESHKIPYGSIRDDLKIMMEKFEEISKQLTNVIAKINRLVLSIVSSVKASFNWLKSIAANCNQRIGSPYHYCKQLLNEGVKDCKDVLGPDYFWLCDVNNVAEATCGDLLKYEHFCGVSALIDDSIPATVKKKLKTFSNRLTSLLYVEVNSHYSYSFSSNASRSASQVAAGIVTEIRNRADPLLTWLSWSSCVTSLFLLLIIFRAKYYQQMYDTRSRFDNRYITQELRDLDLRRLREGRETILPLTRRERAKYVTTTSFRLVTSEKVHLNRSAVFMTITTFKLMIHIIADYSLYWVLMTIQYYGSSQSPVKDELPTISIDVTGSTSFSARLLTSLMNTLKLPLSSLLNASSTSCLPNPYPPDLRRYMQIGSLICLLWFFALFEPYGLRLRHVIMGQYRPERAKARATWLYNHILRTRGSFMKFARKKLHREYKYSTESNLTFRKWIATHIPFKILRFLFGICAEEKKCFLCGTKEYPNDIDTDLIRCNTRTCQGTYCCRCFSDIGQLCTICLSPKDYGDLSDVSLEKGSSEESSDSDIDNNVQGRNRDKFSRGNISQQEKDKYYFRQEHKEKREWNIFSKNGQREDEMPLLPYTNYRTNYMNITHDYKTNYDNEITRINKTSFKLKKTLYNSSKDLNKKCNIWPTSIQKFCSFIKSNLGDCKTLTKNLALTAIRNLKIVTKYIIQSSFYKIENRNNNLSITKFRQLTILAKAIRRQCKSVVRKRPLYKSIINNNNKVGHHLTHRKNVSIGRPDKNNVNESNKQKGQRPKIIKNKEQNKKQIISHKNVKTLNSCFGYFNSSCFKYWRQIKRNLLSCTDPLDISKTLMQSSKEMKNYKRRKKRNNIDLRNSNSFKKSKIHRDDSRKFRMLKYFSDQEWMRKKSEIKFETEHEISKVLKDVKSEDISKAAINSNARSLHVLQTKHKASTKNPSTMVVENCLPSEYQNYHDKINGLSQVLIRKPISRFPDKIGLILQSATSSMKDVDNLTVVKNDQIRKNLISPSPQPSTSFSKRLNFYRSLGANEFDDIYNITNANERTHRLNTKTKSTSKLGKESGLSLAVKKNMNIMQDKGCDTVPVPESALKRDTSTMSEGFTKKWMHIKLRKIKEYCSSTTRGSLGETWSKRNKKHVDIGIQKRAVQTVNKEVSVIPVTQSFSCQCITRSDAKNMTTQTSEQPTKEKSLEPTLDMQIGKVHKICTCATQRAIVQRDIGTCVNHLHQGHLEYNENVKMNSNSSSDVSVAFSESTSVFALNSKTDTTILSLQTIHYEEDRKVRERKLKVPVITKANQSTATDKASVCDVSTVTDDWWTPILERKIIINGPTKRNQREISLERKGRSMFQREKTRKRLKNRGIMTDGKMVTFRSRTQIIPTEVADILSPSRYLLESQKYYNELFIPKYYGARVIPAFHYQKQRSIDKEKLRNCNRPQTRRRK